MTINEKIKNLRLQYNLTQLELAEKLNVTRTAVSKWELSNGTPNLDSIKDIAELFSLTVDDLVNEDIVIEDNIALSKYKEYQKFSWIVLLGYIFCISIVRYFSNNIESTVGAVIIITFNLFLVGTYVYIEFYLLRKKYLTEKFRSRYDSITKFIILLLFISSLIGLIIGLVS